jgi:hypothetical protein
MQGEQPISGSSNTKEFIMNWVFETYSNVYQTAMMHDVKKVTANKSEKKSAFARFFSRG